ncbi:aminoacyl-tRNA deacylase [Facklamia hominis]|uniref:aminoacyl-tRNA deacylase n=1 Tax=Facklamia hominis TaxID=178214 RepID=UPI0003546DBB|nr:aminoacyl-tRNA deacylase [Facklamia hominis]EPH10924.1 YbaK/EbsC protein [Facklamia hominis ACS-120-V-Sch10]
MSKKDKTNVMRVLEQKKVDYQAYEWDQVPKSSVDFPIYKTLVTYGKTGDHYVFVIPTEKYLDLKAAAKAVGEKNIHMLLEKDLLPLTGYVHGGCSPIGMKKQFVTVFDLSIETFDQILFSAGKVGFAVQVSPKDLDRVLDYQLAMITKDKED